MHYCDRNFISQSGIWVKIQVLIMYFEVFPLIKYLRTPIIFFKHMKEMTYMTDHEELLSRFIIAIKLWRKGGGNEWFKLRTR